MKAACADMIVYLVNVVLLSSHIIRDSNSNTPVGSILTSWNLHLKIVW